MLVLNVSSQQTYRWMQQYPSSIDESSYSKTIEVLTNKSSTSVPPFFLTVIYMISHAGTEMELTHSTL